MKFEVHEQSLIQHTTFLDLVSQIKKIGFIKNIQQIQTVWDIKNWLESFMLGSHSFNDCFHIHIHFNTKGIHFILYKQITVVYVKL